MLGVLLKAMVHPAVTLEMLELYVCQVQVDPRMQKQHTCIVLIQVAEKERLDLLVDPQLEKVVLRSVWTMSGALCVTRCGM